MSSRRDIDRAAEKWSAFHWGEEPRELVRASLRVPSHGETLIVLGRLRRVDYETSKAGERAIWWHDFSRPYPYLAASCDRQLHIIGGSYRIEPRGIVG